MILKSQNPMDLTEDIDGNVIFAFEPLNTAEAVPFFA